MCIRDSNRLRQPKFKFTPTNHTQPITTWPANTLHTASSPPKFKVTPTKHTQRITTMPANKRQTVFQHGRLPPPLSLDNPTTDVYKRQGEEIAVGNR